MRSELMPTKIDNSVLHELFYKLDKDPTYIKKIPSSMQTEEMALIIIKKDVKLFKYVSVKTSKVCMEAITKSADSIKYIDAPTKQMCKVAVIANPSVIQYIKDPCEEVCKLA
jgi:hypothetical protein